MSQHAVATDQSTAPASLLARHHFLLRRLHSLSGILPVGLFVIMHLFTNAQMMWGQKPDSTESMFQHEVDFIHSTPALLFIEIGLWSSIGFHAVLGILYMVGWAPNNIRYAYKDNWRYTMQRVTAWPALIFIFLHIATLRWRWDLFGWFTPFYHEAPDTGVPMSMPLTAYALQYHWLVVALYAVGVLSVIYHWSNGLWTAAISWGLTISTAAMRRWGYVCAAMGVFLTLSFGGAMYGALAYDLHEDTQPGQREALKQIIPGWDAGGESAAEHTELEHDPAGQAH